MSTLDAEMQGIFDRAAELAAELTKEYEQAAHGDCVTERAKNLFHEVLVKYRSALDFVMFRVFHEHSELVGQQRTKQERRAGFPVCRSENDFRRKLAELGLAKLGVSAPGLYEKLRQPQPFRTGKSILPIIQDLSNLGKHAELPKQTIQLRPAKRFTKPNGQVMLVTEGVTFGNGSSDPGLGWTVESVTWARFDALDRNGKPIFPEPIWLCLELKTTLRRYVQELLDLL